MRVDLTLVRPETVQKVSMRKRPSKYRPRVLLVEDEAFLAMDIGLTLQAGGYEVLGPCRTIEEATEAVERLLPDIALLDIALGPKETSFQLTTLLRAADIPFIFMSGHVESVLPLPVQLMDVPRLSKPVEPDLLAQHLEDMIRT